MGGIAVPGRKERATRREKKARATRTPKKIEAAVRFELVKIADKLGADIELIRPLLLAGDARTVSRIIRELQDKWRVEYGKESEIIARQWVGAVSQEQKAAFQKNAARALGVDYTTVFDDNIVFDAADLMSVEARDLITNISQEYGEKIRQAVMAAYQQLPLPEGRSLSDEIQHIHGMTKERARLIARDQTSKINTAITKARNEEIGIEEYIWRTAGDSRVVGTPGGLWPVGNKVHGNHYARNGKKFRWDTPPSDGSPGFAINCRCYAEPIIDVEKIKYV